MKGFASLDADRLREVARNGGRAAHARGSAHQFTKEEAQAAGRKGGIAVSRNREHMAAIGRKGAAARSAKRAERIETTGKAIDLIGSLKESLSNG
jgi:Stress-induced bacterial acidophilic repeat motif.